MSCNAYHSLPENGIVLLPRTEQILVFRFRIFLTTLFMIEQLITSRLLR